MPAIGADHECGVRAASILERHAAHTVAVPHELAHPRALDDLDGLCRARPLQQDGVQRRSPHREAVADVARLLGRALNAFRRALLVVELPRQRRAAQGEHRVEHPQPSQDADHPGAAEEVRRGRRAREPRTIEEQDRDAGVAEQRGQRRAGDASSDHDHVIAVPHGATLASSHRRWQ
jgi:hypothetical protein